MIIESARKNDYEELLSIMQECQDYHCSLRPDLYKIIKSSEQLKKREYKKLIKSNMIWVARDKEIMGLVICHRTRKSSQNYFKFYKSLNIDVLSVKEKYKHRGVATELLNYSFEYAKKEKYKKVELQVCASNDAARNLYDRFGFAEKTINMEKTAFL